MGHQLLESLHHPLRLVVALGGRAAQEFQRLFGIVGHAVALEVSARQGKLEARQPALGTLNLELPPGALSLRRVRAVPQGRVGAHIRDRRRGRGGPDGGRQVAGLGLQEGRHAQRQLDGGPRHATQLRLHASRADQAEQGNEPGGFHARNLAPKPCQSKAGVAASVPGFPELLSNRRQRMHLPVASAQWRKPRHARNRALRGSVTRWRGPRRQAGRLSYLSLHSGGFAGVLRPVAGVAANHSATDPLESVWSALADPALPVVRQSWPEARDWPLLPALNALLPGRARRLRQSHDFLAGLLRVPIVAVAGLINAGKSSLVAAFLSPEGRERVLRGIERSAGTHRFVLWAPACWRDDPDMQSALTALLADVFTHAPEPLADSPAEAHEQQRTRHRLRQPLLAYDPALDAHGVCLLDCPDIQRRETEDAEGGRHRREALQAAGRLCSAVVLVLPRSQIEIDQVDEVLRALPNAARVIAVNLAGREAPEAILAEVRAALPAPDALVYLAYDFNHKGYEERTPAWDPNRPLAPEAIAAGASPCFFAVETDGAVNTPEAVAADRSLLRLADRLPPERLLQERQRELLREFATDLSRAMEELVSGVDRQRDQAAVAARALNAEFAPLLGGDDEGRIKLDTRLVGDLADSLVRTAPWDVRPFLWASHQTRGLIRRLQQGVTGLAGAARGLRRRLREGIEQLGPRIEGGLLGEEVVADRLRLWSATCGAHRDRDFWLGPARDVLRRFRDQERTDLTAAEWDALTAGLWQALPKWKARAAVAGTLVMALAAVALVAFDGGTSLVAVLGIKSLGAGALTVTAKELLGVLGFGVIAQSEAARHLQKQLGGQLARQQLANLLALTFDAVGLPRALLGEGLEKPLPPATLPVATTPGTFATEQLNLRLAETDSAALRRLERALKACR